MEVFGMKDYEAEQLIELIVRLLQNDRRVRRAVANLVCSSSNVLCRI
jgi:hypothetical protein